MTETIFSQTLFIFEVEKKTYISYGGYIVGGKTDYVLHKLEAVDEANLGYNYSIVGGTGLDESLEKVEFETSIVAGSDGGSIVKISVKYHTKGDAVLSEAVREETKAKGTGLIKAIEGYVLANPNY